MNEDIDKLDTIWDDLVFAIDEYCDYPLSQKDFKDNIDLITEDVVKSFSNEDDIDSINSAAYDLVGNDEQAIDNIKNQFNNINTKANEESMKKFLLKNSGEIIIRYNRERRQFEDTLKDMIK